MIRTTKLAFVVLTCTSLIVIANCSNRGGPPKVPESASFGWQLKSLKETPAAPRCAHSWLAEYGGPGVVHVNLCETGVGLDMHQKWSPVADRVTFFTNRFFVVVSWQQTQRAALTALITTLEKALN